MSRRHTLPTGGERVARSSRRPHVNEQAAEGLPDAHKYTGADVSAARRGREQKKGSGEGKPRSGCLSPGWTARVQTAARVKPTHAGNRASQKKRGILDWLRAEAAEIRRGIPPPYRSVPFRSPLLSSTHHHGGEQSPFQKKRGIGSGSRAAVQPADHVEVCHGGGEKEQRQQDGKNEIYCRFQNVYHDDLLGDK